MISKNSSTKMTDRDSSGSPVVMTWPSSTEGAGSIPGLDAKILHVSWPRKKKKA